jgi:nitronate monooxygenase
VIDTPYVRKVGLKAGPLARWMLRGRKTKHWMRTIYAVRSLMRLKRSTLAPPRAKRGEAATADYWQAGRSVAGIESVLPVPEIVRSFARAAREKFPSGVPAARAARATLPGLQP